MNDATLNRIADALERTDEALEGGPSAPAEKPAKEPAKEAPAALTALTKDDVKELLMQVSQAKGSSVGRATLEELGANTLSQLDQTLYGALADRCRELLDE